MQEGASLVGEDVDFLTLLDRGADDSEGCAVSAGGQRAGVAVGEHSSFGGHEDSAVPSHGLVGGDVLGVHALGFFDQSLLDLGERSDADALQFFLHAANGPEQIHGGGARLANDIARLIEISLQIADGFGFRILDRQSDAHGGGNADSGCSADDHGADDFGHLFMRLAGDVGFFHGQLRLVDEADALVGPFKGLDHEAGLSSRSSALGSPLTTSDYQAIRGRYNLWAAQRLRGLLVTAGRPQSSHTAATAKITGEVSSFCITCSVRTSRALKIETNGAGAAAFSTLGRPLASSRSTRLITPTTSNPNSRAASMACTVEAPVVQTSSTITTRAPFSREPSMR